MAYNSNNIFARILRGELPCTKVYEDDYCLAFHDISPQAPIHVLVIPKADYVDFDSFAADAPPEMVAGYMAGIARTARILGVEENGFRLIANNGRDAGQIVDHLHFHICAGRDLGRMIAQE
jgi:diadenosine tetraphosphate (Ap4A) HIT family hydrolase